MRSPLLKNFFIKDFFSECDQIRKTAQKTADLVTFTEEIVNGKIHFLCSGCVTILSFDSWRTMGDNTTYLPFSLPFLEGHLVMPLTNETKYSSNQEFFKGRLPQTLLGSFLNALSQIIFFFFFLKDP